MHILLGVLFLACASWALPVPQPEVDYTSMYLAQFPKEDLPDDIPAEILRENEKVQVNPSDVLTYFYSKSGGGSQVNISNADDVKKSGFSSSKDTVFLIHGWRNDHTSEIGQSVKNAYLAVADVNVFVVDWGSIAKKEYATAKLSVVDVGRTLGAAISAMEKGSGLSLDKTSFVGHSLGAHVAGCAGKALHGKVDHIVGLDPAGPLFSMKSEADRIARTDAKFVQIVHTSAGKLGFNGDLGAADYWPNGGHSQPGCSIDATGSCAHGRSYQYFAESIRSGNFKAWKCDSYNSFEKGSCSNGATSFVGQISLDKSASGEYYLDTNSNSPYAKGK